MKKRIIIRQPKFKNGGVVKRQEGGAVPAEQAPSTDPQAQLQEMLMQYAESKSPEVAVMIADMILEQYVQSQQPAAEASAPTEDMPEGEPMGRYGMSMKKIKR